MEKWKKRIVGQMMLLALLCLMAGCKTGGDDKILIGDGARQGLPEETPREECQEDGLPSEETQIYVQVCGAVAHPGVYALPAGSRIFQAVELAGGLTEAAEEKGLNQAGILSDGQMIYVMDREEAAAQQAPAGEAGEDGRVDLNIATEAELMGLPGIGEAKAKSIVAWREENGRFAQIEDLMKIPGIKEGVFAKMKDSVKVSQ
ncbi:helix-hairpin-helix domain-containing protein [Lachnospiraceae bacterium 29-84]